MKKVVKGKGGMDMRAIALATAGGAAIMLVGAQLLARPNLPKVASPTSNSRRAGAPGTPGGFGTVAQQPAQRNLFQPLVTPPHPVTQPVGPPVVAPPLPNAKPVQKPKPPTPPVVSKPTNTISPPPAPTGPRVDDIQMLGVVELDGQPQALLKRSTTGESRYFAKGENAFGFTVESIQDSDVSLVNEGKTFKVSMSSAVTVEGPSGTTVAGNSGFTGGGGGGRRGDREGRRGNRNGGGGNFGGGGNGGGGGASTDSGAAEAARAIFALPTYTERLKKLEEVKGKLSAESYGRLKKLFAEKAAEEQKEKK